MTELTHGGPWGSIVRPVKLTDGWPGGPRDNTEDDPQLIYAGPVVLDAYNSLRQLDPLGLIERLVTSTQRAGEHLSGWSVEQQREFRSISWRSAHRFIVDNINLIDRGREVEDLARALKIKL